MNDQPLQQDPELGALLSDLHRGAAPEPDWDDLHRKTVARAAPELARLRGAAAARAGEAGAYRGVGAAAPAGGTGDGARRRGRAWRWAVVVPAAVAASLAVLLLWPAAPAPEDAGTGGAIAGTELEVDALMDADITEDQFRAVLFGAADTHALLLLAAGDPDES
jgi:hypothetical protein